MSVSGSRIARHRPGHSTLLLASVLATVLAATPALAGNPRWVLVYYRQFGNHINGGNHTIESHLFREDGSKAAGVGLTNEYNADTAIFGNTDPDGWNRITTTEPVFAYDLLVYRPDVASDHTPNFYWQNPAAEKYYSFETQWLYVLDEARINAYPQRPVYHYDLVNGLNNEQLQEPPGTNSDAFSLLNWADYQAQTFVVPEGINRIVSAQAYVTRNLLTHFQYRASIHEGGPTGPQVGPAVVSRCVVSIEFFPVLVSWPLHAVPVEPGQTYALRLEPVLNHPVCAETTDPGFNVHATVNNNYAAGMAYNGATVVSGRDLLAIVVGVGYDIPNIDPPVISISPSLLEREIAYGEDLGESDSLTLTNTGGSPLHFTMGNDADWIVASPPGGRLEPGASQAIVVDYATSSLMPGIHTGVISAVDPLAANSPQTVTIQLTVIPPLFAPVDFDRDGDVDQQDFGRFQVCYSGPGIPQDRPECAGARLDGDDDVDQADFEIFFLKCLTGPGGQADPTCNR